MVSFLTSPVMGVVGSKTTMRWSDLWWSLAVVILMCSCKVMGLPAKDQYFMDQRSDCFAAGIQSIARDQMTIVHGRSETPGPRLDCRVQFEPAERGDTLTVSFGPSAYVTSSGVELSVAMTRGGGSYSYGSLSTGTRPPVLEAVNGVATIILKKNSIEDEFNFELIVSAKETIDPNPPDDSGTANVGLIIGLITAAIIIIVIIAVIILCFIRKRKENVKAADEPLEYPDGRTRSRSFNRIERVEKSDQGSVSNLSLSYDKRSIQF